MLTADERIQGDYSSRFPHAVTKFNVLDGWLFVGLIKTAVLQKHISLHGTTTSPKGEGAAIPLRVNEAVLEILELGDYPLIRRRVVVGANQCIQIFLRLKSCRDSFQGIRL